MKHLKNLSPQPLWSYFEEICQVPRPSKKEEKIIQFLLDFAQANGLKVRRDEIGNVLISKPATPGRENDPVVVLQSHMDMVCEKNSETEHNFENRCHQTVYRRWLGEGCRNYFGLRRWHWNSGTNGCSYRNRFISRTHRMFVYC